MSRQESVDKIIYGNIFKLVIEMAIPSAASMLIIILYGLTDTFFVSRIGFKEIAAVGIAFSFINLIQAFGLLYGHGSGNYISRMQGKRNKLEAERMSICGFCLAVITGIIILISSIYFMDDLIIFLGAKGDLVQITKEYLSILIFGTPLLLISLTVNNQLRLQGKPRIGALALIIGALINCFFDPIFIFLLNLGVRGAAIATILGQSVSFIILIYYVLFINDIKIKKKRIHFDYNILKEIYFGGLPNFAREICIAISILILNNILSSYGQDYIASFTLISKMMQAGTYLMVGVGHGFQPICGINYGAKLYDRVIKVFKCTLTISVLLTIIIEIIFLSNSEGIIRLFTENYDVIKIADKLFRIQSLTFPLVAYIIISGMFLQNTHQFKWATLLTTSRQGIVYIPILITLNFFYGIDGVYYSQIVTDILTFIIAMYFIRKNKEILLN